jgi:hypothetical protein
LTCTGTEQQQQQQQQHTDVTRGSVLQ